MALRKGSHVKSEDAEFKIKDESNWDMKTAGESPKKGNLF